MIGWYPGCATFSGLPPDTEFSGLVPHLSRDFPKMVSLNGTHHNHGWEPFYRSNRPVTITWHHLKSGIYSTILIPYFCIDGVFGMVLTYDHWDVPFHRSCRPTVIVAPSFLTSNKRVPIHRRLPNCRVKSILYYSTVLIRLTLTLGTCPCRLPF